MAWFHSGVILGGSQDHWANPPSLPRCDTLLVFATISSEFATDSERLALSHLQKKVAQWSHARRLSCRHHAPRDADGNIGARVHDVIAP